MYPIWYDKALPCGMYKLNYNASKWEINSNFKWCETYSEHWLMTIQLCSGEFTLQY